jgi:hypothetical protein
MTADSQIRDEPVRPVFSHILDIQLTYLQMVTQHTSTAVAVLENGQDNSRHAVDHEPVSDF